MRVIAHDLIQIIVLPRDRHAAFPLKRYFLTGLHQLVVCLPSVYILRDIIEYVIVSIVRDFFPFTVRKFELWLFWDLYLRLLLFAIHFQAVFGLVFHVLLLV